MKLQSFQEGRAHDSLNWTKKANLSGSKALLGDIQASTGGQEWALGLRSPYHVSFLGTPVPVLREPVSGNWRKVNSSQCCVHPTASPGDGGQSVPGATTSDSHWKAWAPRLTGEDTSWSAQRDCITGQLSGFPDRVPPLALPRSWEEKLAWKRIFVLKFFFTFKATLKSLWLGHAFFLLPERLHHFQFVRNQSDIQIEPLFIIAEASELMTINDGGSPLYPQRICSKSPGRRLKPHRNDSMCIVYFLYTYMSGSSESSWKMCVIKKKKKLSMHFKIFLPPK